MDNEYVLITENGELTHWGIKGMKWGRRRYQNKDGSLTPAGKKRYAEEEAALKSREKVIKNQERTKAKLAKLDAKKAELDAREKALDDSNKAKTANTAKTTNESTKPSDTSKQKPASDMSDNELQAKVNRLRNEDAYKDLSKKLGYDVPLTELDLKIAEMEKQKRYLELQRDIKNLTPEKVSAGKKLMNTIIKDVVTPAATNAGKKVLERFLTDTGLDAVGKFVGEKAKQEAAKAAETAAKNAKKETAQKAWREEYEAKKAAKEADKKAKKAAKAEQKIKDEAERKSREEYENDPYRNHQGEYSKAGGSREHINPNTSRGRDYTESAGVGKTNASVYSKIGALTASGNKTYAEIADQLGVSVSTVQNYSKAREQTNRWVDENGTITLNRQRDDGTWEYDPYY